MPPESAATTAPPPPAGVEIRTPARAAETAWFSGLCNDDYALLGVPDGRLRSSFAHCAGIVRTADRLGYQNILLPSSYQVGQDTLTFAAAVAPSTKQISLLTAVRGGELHPPMLARALSTLDHLLEGRLTVNVISSDLPGSQRPADERYQRSREMIQILRQAWTRDRIEHHGELYRIDLPSDPVRPWQQNGGPLLYFGGISEGARELCAEQCDVFLMWPETEERIVETMRDLARRAARHGRRIDFGYRVHVIVRETESEAREAARTLVSRLDDETGRAIKQRALDAGSAGVARQDALRESAADAEGYLEAQLWSGIGRARSGCGSAIVGDPDQVRAKLERYLDLGIRAFILSGYPLRDECELFARHVLPDLPSCRLADAQGRRPSEPPETPLTTGRRR